MSKNKKRHSTLKNTAPRPQKENGSGYLSRYLDKPLRKFGKSKGMKS